MTFNSLEKLVFKIIKSDKNLTLSLETLNKGLNSNWKIRKSSQVKIIPRIATNAT
jgi:hypothetical protein